MMCRYNIRASNASVLTGEDKKSLTAEENAQTANPSRPKQHVLEALVVVSMHSVAASACRAVAVGGRECAVDASAGRCSAVLLFLHLEGTPLPPVPVSRPSVDAWLHPSSTCDSRSTKRTSVNVGLMIHADSEWRFSCRGDAGALRFLINQNFLPSHTTWR